MIPARSTPRRQTLGTQTLGTLGKLALGALTLAAVFALIGTQVQAAPLDHLERDVNAARQFDYCAWAHEDGGTATDLPDYAARLDRATTTLGEEARAATLLIDAGTRIALASASARSCTRTFRKGERAFDKALTRSTRSHGKRARYEPSDDSDIRSVQSRLADHWIADQSARRVYIASRTDDRTGANHWHRVLAGVQTNQADMASTALMRELLARYDWIDSHRFGDRVSMAAWLMVQHADAHLDLQELALSRMEPFLDTGGVTREDYAFLWDRVAVNSDRLQRYGTQPTWECDDDRTMALKPMEDPARVNERRTTMGMGPVEDSLAEMSRSVCG